MRRAGKGLRSIFLATPPLLLLAGAFLFVRSLLLPSISSVSPRDFDPGSKVSIQGKGFGEERGSGSVELDGTPLTATSYLSWSGEEIDFLVPYSLDSGILRVKGPWGRSNPEAIVSRFKTPMPPSGEAAVSVRPVVDKLSPEEAAVGELLVIEGLGFGSNLQFSSVRFPKSKAEATANESSSSEEYVEPQVDQSMYESWDDKRIVVRVPEGAGSGVLVVKTPQGSSEPYTFRVKSGTGSKYLFDPIVYTIEFRVDAYLRSGSAGPFFVYLPDPPTTSSQSLDSIGSDATFSLPGASGGYVAYRFEAEGEGKAIRTARLTVRGVETDLSSYKDKFKGPIPTFLLPYLADEPTMPAASKDVKALVVKIVGAEANPQRKATLIWTWMKKTLVWNDQAPVAGRTALSALREGRGDARQCAFLACALLRAAQVPAVPVAGLLVLKDGKLFPHCWLEYYLPALGWIPFDPSLASGARPGGFEPGFDDSGRYFGSLDNRHLAVTRGTLTVTPRLKGSRLKESGAAWSLQTLYEEAQGSGATSSWAPVALTGRY